MQTKDPTERDSARALTVGQVAAVATGGNEQAARKLLRAAGAVLDVYAVDPAERVAREVVIDALAHNPGRVARKLAELLGSSMNEPQADAEPHLCAQCGACDTCGR